MKVVFLLVTICLPFVWTADKSDEITNLPGVNPQPKFKHYSGYLQASPTHFLHYWYVESQNNPSTDPLVIWLNGGPGCSSMDGLLNEHGPYLATTKGDLRMNPFSWNMVANVLYIESPAGVGYSYATDGNVTTDDDQVSAENYAALMQFYGKFPELLSHDLYITGESYGGVYVPTFAERVMTNSSIKLKGILVGNGLSDYNMNDNSLIYFANYHGLIGEMLWSELLRECCDSNGTEHCMFTTQKRKPCQAAVARSTLALNGLNIYNLYLPCYGGVPNSFSSKKNGESSSKSKSSYHYLDGSGHLFRDNIYVKQIRQMRHEERIRDNVGLDPPCTNSTAISQYLNSANVRSAIHIPSNLPTWTICSDKVSASYKSVYRNMERVYRHLLSAKKYRILIYNGDVDMACNYLGDQWFFDGLRLPLSDSRRQWYFKSQDGTKQVGGFLKSYTGGITLLTVRGSGHMVPQDKPRQAFHMFDQFLKNQPI